MLRMIPRAPARNALAAAATAAGRRSMGIKDKLNEFFVQGEGLSKSQAQESAKEFRPKAPGTLTKEENPHIPAGEPGREYSVAFYNRDTTRDPTWQYKNAEGGIADASPQKYMDGTPYMVKPEGVRVPHELLAEVNGLPTDPSMYYFGEREADGSIPKHVLAPGTLGKLGPSHCPMNSHLTFKDGEVIMGSKPMTYHIHRDCERPTY
mmetsp:Transcript_67/g.224  ORF Transcript_67/g.224 Transcript_67/m.224 type:complete len:207 (+) Transcript_67:89-709(+)|eukprot:CAMPEP_0173390034 /NCGR_PEP_ID=MMETSP1356-20130122/14255_1 /TAXON_ID=77927 ORGANISM="Hemiselmis virescens, Strain PCC157" /NCGR_SAMPLE_ID=MMETSP1356 /ASSEMBLY_ACC=CAM_ASM_000847 /LENGTH=206 /DNA_ID=CAMNT_0014347343 /DNA_START=64 /DNA_END=684 /DNA_ORIENTATION=+